MERNKERLYNYPRQWQISDWGWKMSKFLEGHIVWGGGSVQVFTDPF